MIPTAPNKIDTNGHALFTETFSLVYKNRQDSSDLIDRKMTKQCLILNN